MKPVTLDPVELAMCRMMGNLRSHASRVADSNTSQLGRRNVIDMDENGFIGEYAFAKYHNLFFDITAKPRRKGYDFLFQGKRIDVKTTDYGNGKLMVRDIDNTDIDVYVLAVFDGETVSFPGYCSVSRLKAEADRLPNTDGTFRYEMIQEELTPWKERQ